MIKFRLLLLIFLLINSQLIFSQSTNTMIVDWGDNTYAQLFGPFQNVSITDVSTGYEHTLAIQDGTTVIAWGSNNYGQRDVPSGIVNPIKVSAGLGHSLVLQQDGSVKGWGFNDFGQIDVNSYTDIIDISAGDEHTILLHSDGTVTVLATNTTYDQTPPAGLTDVIAVSAGNFHNLALKSDGTVVAWGADEFGQTSDLPAGLSNVAAISAGHFHSIALLNDGSVVGWGDNSLFDQITVPGSLTSGLQIDAGNFHTIAIDGNVSNNHLEGWGSDRFTETLIPQILQGRTIHSITAGFAHNTLVVSNSAPTNILPHEVYLSENTELLTEFALVTVTDPDVLDSHLIDFVDSPDDTDEDNGSFIFKRYFTGAPKEQISDDILWGSVSHQDILTNVVTFDYETKKEYHVRLKATDIGGLSIEQAVTIYIINENDTPTVVNLDNDTILEHQPIGTEIGTFTTEDPDADDTHSYTLVEGDGDKDNASFTISGDKLLSAEVFDEDTQNTYLIRVRSTDAGGFFVERQFAITVIETNNPPTDITLSEDEILENESIGSLVGFFETEDPDPDDAHSYSLVEGNGDSDNEFFTITSNSLLTNTTFDYDVKNEYFIRVRTTDDGTPENQFFEKEFTIKILPFNYPPEISGASFEVFEDAENDTDIGTVTASDDGTITYEITSGNTNNVFKIDPLTGLISVNDNTHLDYATTPSYSLNITVTDDGGLTASAVVVIVVIGVNNPPVINDQVFTVREDVTNNAYIASISATDDRVITNYTILEGSLGGAFEMSSQNGVLTVLNNEEIDAEITPTYGIRVQVTDDEGLTDDALITINIEEVILAPVVSNQIFHIGENAENNTEVGVIAASDDGIIESYDIISGNINNVFDLNAQLGQITVFDNQTLDYEVLTQYDLVVRVSDDDNQFTEANITIMVDDENDAPIVDDQTFEIFENVENGFQVGIVRAEDDDGSVESFTILDGNSDGIYSIDSQVGVITIADNSNLEEGTHILSISVSDNDGLTDEANITINVSKVVNPPIAQDQTFEIEEDPISNTVGEFIASSENALIYTIISGNPDGTFAIDSQNGMISVNNVANLDAVDVPIHTLIISVIDATDPDLSTSAKAFILVNDSNFAPTDILLDGDQIDEQQPSGTKIGDFSTLDPDLVDRHTYTLASGSGDDDNASFSILNNNLFSDAVFSFEDKNILRIRVRSTDDGQPNKFVEKSFIITVNSLPLPQIPTAITPNGDGENDVWEIPNLDIHTQSTTKVYDRSGQLVFSSQGYNRPWDGTSGGKDLPIATYFYVIQLNNAAGTKYSGSVTIIR